MLLRILDLFQLDVTQAAIEMHESRQNGALPTKKRNGKTNNKKAKSDEITRPWMNDGATRVAEDTRAILTALVKLGRTETLTIFGMLLALRACVRSHGHETEQLVHRLTGVPFGAAGNPDTLMAIISAVGTALIPSPHVSARHRRRSVQPPDASVVELANIVRSLWELHDSDDNLTSWYMNMCGVLAARGGLLDDDASAAHAKPADGPARPFKGCPLLVRRWRPGRDHCGHCECPRQDLAKAL
jgi:hypothetical protein